MRITARRAVGGMVLVCGVAMLRPGTRANELAHHQINRARRKARYIAGRLRGVTYQLSGQHPDLDVVDSVLADRIRSSLGGVERRLDLPHIHVMVEDHVAMLHGEVSSDADAVELVRAVADVPGVVRVESNLHVGLGGGDTRPSVGRSVHPPSAALQRLLDAAVGAGVEPDSAMPVVRGVLATFADRLPAGERDHVASHLPYDVRPLFTPPRRASGHALPRTVPELVAAITSVTGELPQDKAERATAAVIETLGALVPDEVSDVTAVLPDELRALWLGPSVGGHRWETAASSSP